MRQWWHDLLWHPYLTRECCIACGEWCNAAYPIALVATQRTVYACNASEADLFIAEHSAIRLHRDWPLAPQGSEAA